MRCDKCAHWSIEQGEEIINVRRCNKALELWEATEWNEDYDRVAKPNFEGQMMFVMDGSSYSASLYTRPDFFCAHYAGTS